MKVRLLLLGLVLVLVSGLALSGVVNRWMNKLTQQDPPFEALTLEYQFKSDLVTVKWTPETQTVTDEDTKAVKMLRPTKITVEYVEYITDDKEVILAEHTKTLTVVNRSRVGTKTPTFTWEISE